MVRVIGIRNTVLLFVNVRPVAVTEETTTFVEDVPAFTIITSLVPVVVRLHDVDVDVVPLEQEPSS